MSVTGNNTEQCDVDQLKVLDIWFVVSDCKFSMDSPSDWRLREHELTGQMVDSLSLLHIRVLSQNHRLLLPSIRIVETNANQASNKAFAKETQG